MQHAEPIPRSFPWRGTALVVAGIAAVELVALVSIGAAHLVPARHAAAPAVERVPVRRVVHLRKVAPPPSHPLRARTSVRVLVLNGNGVQGAAATEAARLRSAGYRIGGAMNAERHNYARSMVLYVPGWIKEARRLAHDTGVRLVAPVDGLRPKALRGSKTVVILGNP